MSLPNIKVGDTVRIADRYPFAVFVNKGDVAKVTNVVVDGEYIDLTLESFGWPWDQIACVKVVGEGNFKNKSVTFLHDSQKLVDKPSK